MIASVTHISSHLPSWLLSKSQQNGSADVHRSIVQGSQPSSRAGPGSHRSWMQADAPPVPTVADAPPTPLVACSPPDGSGISVHSPSPRRHSLKLSPASLHSLVPGVPPRQRQKISVPGSHSDRAASFAVHVAATKSGRSDSHRRRMKKPRVSPRERGQRLEKLTRRCGREHASGLVGRSGGRSGMTADQRIALQPVPAAVVVEQVSESDLA